jgi:anti-sigma regulatory factor (Ser/Thr protein kinase)
MEAEKYTLEVAAAVENMAAVMAFAEEHIASVGDPKTARQLATVAEEASLNVFKYAYDGRQGMFALDICLDSQNRKIIMEFSDSGKPFNPLLRDGVNVNLPVSQREIGGMGITLIKNFTDEQRYVRENGRNILTVAKYY